MTNLRVGHGYDVHRLVEGRPLILGGVTVPYEKGLLGHSDADVLTHAVMDALLGAAGLPDIGNLFPDNDKAFFNISSIYLLQQVGVKLKEAGARRALPLPVGGAFHSPLMEPARTELAQGIREVEFKTPLCPVYQNVTAEPSTDPEEIKSNLLAQLTSPVRWTQSVRRMIADGATGFTEVGPGKVLQGLVSKIADGPVDIGGCE